MQEIYNSLQEDQSSLSSFFLILLLLASNWVGCSKLMLLFRTCFGAELLLAYANVYK